MTAELRTARMVGVLFIVATAASLASTALLTPVLDGALNLPIAVQEMVLAGWLLVRGFAAVGSDPTVVARPA